LVKSNKEDGTSWKKRSLLFVYVKKQTRRKKSQVICKPCALWRTKMRRKRKKGREWSREARMFLEAFKEGAERVQVFLIKKFGVEA
jgi:hypothetical protein